MLIDNAVTRFPGGINNLSVSDIFNSLKMSDPTKYHTYLEDFDYFVAASWTVTETQGAATQALGNGDGGLLVLVNSAASADVNQVQKVGESFLLEAGKKLFLRARCKVDDATNGIFVVGLQVTNTDGAGSVTDGIYFIKPAAATTIVARCRKNTTTGAVEANVTAAVSDTFIVLEMFYDGVDRLYYGYNGTIVGYLDAASTHLPDTTLAPVFEVKNGTAAARTGTFDKLFVAKEI